MEVKKATHNRDRVRLFRELDEYQISLKDKLDNFKKRYNKISETGIATSNSSNNLYDEVQ